MSHGSTLYYAHFDKLTTASLASQSLTSNYEFLVSRQFYATNESTYKTILSQTTRTNSTYISQGINVL